MSILSFLKKKEEVSIVVDIGNGVVTGALVSFVKNTKPNILYIKKIPFLIKDRLEKDKLVADMKKLLEKVLEDLLKHNKGSLERVMLTFSSPWYLLKAKSVEVEEEKFFTITNTFLQEIAEREAKNFQDESNENIPVTADDSYEVIEKSIINSKVNGYQFSNIINKKTKQFSAFLCLSLVPKSVENQVIRIIQKHTHIQRSQISMHTFPLVMFSVVRDSFMAGANFVMMDITSEVTDIILVQNDTIVKNSNFPFGRNYIIRKIAEGTGVSNEIAESTLKMYLESKLDDSSLESVNLILGNIQKEWDVYFEDAMLSFSADMAIPKTIFVTGEDDISVIFESFLKTPIFDKTEKFREGLKIIKIDEATLSHLYQTEFILDSDAFIAIESIFYNKIISSN